MTDVKEIFGSDVFNTFARTMSSSKRLLVKEAMSVRNVQGLWGIKNWPRR
jgi:hypothetical protein